MQERKNIYLKLELVVDGYDFSIDLVDFRIVATFF
jgi:hypothetical protein